MDWSRVRGPTERVMTSAPIEGCSLRRGSLRTPTIYCTTATHSYSTTHCPWLTWLFEWSSRVKPLRPNTSWILAFSYSSATSYDHDTGPVGLPDLGAKVDLQASSFMSVFSSASPRSFPLYSSSWSVALRSRYGPSSSWPNQRAQINVCVNTKAEVLTLSTRIYHLLKK